MPHNLTKREKITDLEPEGDKYWKIEQDPEGIITKPQLKTPRIGADPVKNNNYQNYRAGSRERSQINSYN